MSGNLREYVADLHVHTALSPCADYACTPPEIVLSALRRGIDIIAITDHNSAENIEAVVSAAAPGKLTVIPGMEVTTIEETHIVCLFKDMESALSLQKTIYSLLPNEDNDPEIFGRQQVMDEKGGVVRECPKMLAASAGIKLEEAVRTVHEMGGLVFAAHVDRPSYSIISNLGWIPPEAGLDAVEISAVNTKEKALSGFPEIAAFPIVTASDAHHPDSIGAGITLFLLEDATIEEIHKALLGIDEREHLIQ